MAKKFFHGQDTVAYFKAATALGAIAVPVAGDAFRILTATITPEQDRTPVEDEKGHRSMVSTFEGRRRAGVEIVTLVQPPAAGIGAQLDGVLRNFFGQAPNVVANVSSTYGIAEDLSASIGNLWFKTSVGHEAVVGAIINSLNLTWGNDAPMQFTFGGMAQDWGIMAETTIVAAGASTSAFLPADEGFVSGVGAIVMIAGAGNTAQAVEAFDGDTRIATLAADQTWVAGAAVGDGIPAPSYGTERNRLYGTEGSISFDGGTTTIDDIVHTGGSFDANNGHTLYEGDAFTRVATDTDNDADRAVSVNLSFDVREENLFLFERARYKKTVDLVVTLGAIAGRRLVLDAPKVEIDVAPISTPVSGRATVSFSGMVQASTAGADEFTLAFA